MTIFDYLRIFGRRSPQRLMVLAFAALLASGIIFGTRYLAFGQRYDSRSDLGSTNGFDVSNASVPVDKIMRGGPPRDGIPAILKPDFLRAADVEYLRPDDKVVGLVRGDVARAYPLRILVWHEIVNDTIGVEAIAVTYCPLCGTSMVFDRRYEGRVLTFGVSGLLYQSDVLMYDHQTESLWSQLKLGAISGPLTGTELTWIPAHEMTWAAWKEKFPESEVLSTDTGYRRNYLGSAYAGHETRDRLMFPVPRYRNELRNKEWVVGILLNGKPKAYPVKLLAKFEEPLVDEVGGIPIELHYDTEAQSPSVIRTDSRQAVPHVSAYWFAWQAFYPDTELHQLRER